MAQKSTPLRQKIREWPAQQNLSNEATSIFNKTFKEQDGSVSAQAAFAAAKKAVEALPKDRRYRSNTPDGEDESNYDDGDVNSD